MENDQNISNTPVSNEKGVSLSTIIVFGVLIVAIIGFFVFKANKNGDNAPNTENTATTTEQTATTTATTSTEVNTGATAPAPTPTPSIDTGVKVIQGNGYTATLKPVYGEAPIINTFTMTKVDETCRFSWDASKAKRCDFLNTETKTGFKDAGSEGTVQMNDAGKYLVRCYGDGGKSATSETLSCN